MRAVRVNQNSKLRTGQLNNELKFIIKLRVELQIQVMILCRFTEWRIVKLLFNALNILIITENCHVWQKCSSVMLINALSRFLNTPLTVVTSSMTARLEWLCNMMPVISSATGHIAEVNSHFTLIIQWFPQVAAVVHIQLYNPWCCATLWYIKTPN